MLRGINLGPNRRVPMADLRALFGQEGYGDVRTYVQSGNIVLDSTATAAELEREAAALISQRFGFDVPVVVRTGRQLAAVVKRNPLGDVADDPKRYQVSFLAAKLGRRRGQDAAGGGGRRVGARGLPRPRDLRLAPRGRGALQAVERPGGQAAWA